MGVDVCSFFLLCVSTILIVQESNADVARAVSSTTSYPQRMFLQADIVITSLFFVEVCVRFWMLGRSDFVKGHDKLWNLFDCVQFIIAFLDVFHRFWRPTAISGLKPIRTIRLVRMFKYFHHVRDVRFMVAALMSSMRALMWGLLLIMFLIFGFAVLLTQSLAMHLSTENDSSWDDVLATYGDVANTMFSLFSAITGGSDWGDLLEPLIALSSMYYAFFGIYISLMTFGILNVLTGIFCERASQIVRIDRGLVIEEEMGRIQLERRQIKKVFDYANVRKDGQLSKKELDAFLVHPTQAAMLHLLSIDEAEARGIFDIVDTTGKRSVHLNTYVDAILRLRGTAKGCDTTQILLEHKRLLVRLEAFMDYTSDCFRSIGKVLHASLASETCFSKEALSLQEAAGKNEVSERLVSHLGMMQTCTLPKSASVQAFTVSLDDARGRLESAARRAARAHGSLK